MISSIIEYVCSHSGHALWDTNDIFFDYKKKKLASYFSQCVRLLTSFTTCWKKPRITNIRWPFRSSNSPISACLTPLRSIILLIKCTIEQILLSFPSFSLSLSLSLSATYLNLYSPLALLKYSWFVFSVWELSLDRSVDAFGGDVVVSTILPRSNMILSSVNRSLNLPINRSIWLI